MTVHKIIRERRKQLGLSVEKFAELCGVSRRAVQLWELEDAQGGTAPNRQKQPDVARVLGLSLAQLLGVGDNTQAGPEVWGSVPLISAVQAGEYKMHVDNDHPGDGGKEKVDTTVPVKRHTFALRVVGDSMEPEFVEGAVLIIEPEMEPQPGDYVVAKGGDGEITFKQLVRDAGEWYLKPTNERYPIRPLGKSAILGVVRAVERRFR